MAVFVNGLGFLHTCTDTTQITPDSCSASLGSIGVRQLPKALQERSSYLPPSSCVPVSPGSSLRISGVDVVAVN